MALRQDAAAPGCQAILALFSANTCTIPQDERRDLKQESTVLKTFCPAAGFQSSLQQSNCSLTFSQSKKEWKPKLASLIKGCRPESKKGGEPLDYTLQTLLVHLQISHVYPS